MTNDHRWVQPTFVPGAMTHIQFRCPCGWTTTPVRPELAGAWTTTKTDYANHLACQSTDSLDRDSQPNRTTDSYVRTDVRTDVEALPPTRDHPTSRNAHTHTANTTIPR